MGAAVIPCIINDCSNSMSSFAQNVVGAACLIVLVGIVVFFWWDRRR